MSHIDLASWNGVFRRTLAAAFGIAAFAAALVLFGCSGDNKLPLDTAAAERGLLSIISGAFVVPPRNFKPFEFIVMPGMVSPRLEGTFSANGAGNDIEVLLLDESQFLNWQNKLPFKATYSSGRITADKFRIDLPSDPAKYVVIFSNRFSMFAKKGVIADLKLLYDR